MENNSLEQIHNRNYKIGVTLIVLAIIATIAGGTFAYFQWVSSDAQKTLVTFTVTQNYSCSVDGGGNITSSNVSFEPATCTNSTYAIKRKLTTNATLDSTIPALYMNIWLDVKELGTGLSNSQNFKYAVTSSSTSCDTDVIKTGNFNGKVTNDKVYLLEDIEYSETTTDEYYLWVWLDKDEESTSTMNQAVNLQLNGSCEIAPATPAPVSFATDSWATIKKGAKSGTSVYHVGDTKCVALTGFTTTNNNGCQNGEFLVRIANTSTPSECSDTDFSQTACGFVFEFVDIIVAHNMNPSGTYKGVEYSNGWNVDGWPATSMKSYIDSTIYNALPSDLQTSIITTKTISGHGNTSGETNFVSNDKLYLLAPHEVWEQGSSNTITYDTAYNNTRQLDYYRGLGVTTNNYAGAIKYKNGSASYWWLRAADYYNFGSSFYSVYTSGDWSFDTANTANGLAPAFRLA